MADHVVGTMDTSVQEKTYAGFIRLMVRGVIAILAVLIFLALFNS